MSFKLLYEKRFVKDLSGIPQNLKNLVRKKLEWLALHVSEVKHVKLKGEDFQNVFRLRIGEWRVFYRIEHTKETIYILSIKHRKDAYK